METNSGPGWHADPFGRFPKRWRDGNNWSMSVTAGTGEVLSDPIQPQSPPASGTLTPASHFSAPVVPSAPYQPYAQTLNFNLPGGGAWAAPQQLVVTNASKSPGMAIASMVLGIGSFFFALIPIFGLTSIPFAICGLALGVAGVMRASKGFEGKGLAVTGVVTSVAALLVSVVYIFAIGVSANDSPEINSDRSDGVCNPNRPFQDPDC